MDTDAELDNLTSPAAVGARGGATASKKPGQGPLVINWGVVLRLLLQHRAGSSIVGLVCMRHRAPPSHDASRRSPPFVLQSCVAPPCCAVCSMLRDASCVGMRADRLVPLSDAVKRVLAEIEAGMTSAEKSLTNTLSSVSGACLWPIVVTVHDAHTRSCSPHAAG